MSQQYEVAKDPNICVVCGAKIDTFRVLHIALNYNAHGIQKELANIEYHLPLCFEHNGASLADGNKFKTKEQILDMQIKYLEDPAKGEETT